MDREQTNSEMNGSPEKSGENLISSAENHSEETQKEAILSPEAPDTSENTGEIPGAASAGDNPIPDASSENSIPPEESTAKTSSVTGSARIITAQSSKDLDSLPVPEKKKSNKHLKIALAVVAVLLALSTLLCLGLGVVAVAAFILKDRTPVDPSLPPYEVSQRHSNDQDPPQTPAPSVYDPNAWINTGALDNPNAIVNVAAKCSPSVVAISTDVGAGSGVIWSSDGYIVTNNHVVNNASSIEVMLSNGEKYPATRISTDAENDLALLRIHVKGLLPVTKGDSENLLVGETVIAIGNPLGTLAGTVTDGILSALARDITVEGTKMNLMQISAAINPGNSGGGCFDINGNLIGIVNAKTSASGIEGLGFAIPINTVKRVINGMIENDSTILRKSFGITGCYEIRKDNYSDYSQNNLVSKIEELNGKPLYGIYIVSDGLVDYVDSNNRFANGDVLRSVNGVSIQTLSDINNLLENAQKGDELTVVLTRLVSTSYGFMQTKYSLEEVTVKVRVIEMYR